MPESAPKPFPTTLEGCVETDAVIAFQRRSWTVERVGWLVMGAVCLAGFLGLLGGGPLAQRTIAGPGFELTYQAFTRLGGRERLELRLPGRSGEARVALATPYVDRVQIEEITPQPLRVVAEGRWTTFVFAIDSTERAHLIFAMAPLRPGALPGRIRVDGGEPVAFRQLVYP